MNLASVGSAAVFRALRLGDMLCAVPAFRALRAAAPHARVTLIGLPWAAEFASRYPGYIDDFVAFPGYPGLAGREPDMTLFPPFLSSMQRRVFDLAVQLHGGGTSANAIALLLGARRTAGFYTPGDFLPDPETFAPYPETGPEAERLLTVTDRLGAPRRGAYLEFAVTEADLDEWRRLCSAHGLPAEGCVCVHPGARRPGRRWPLERFAAAADRLARDGHPIALMGTESERGLTAEAARLMREPAANLGGLTSLGALAAALSGARLLLCGDTGVSRLGAALGTRRVVVGSDVTAERAADQAGELLRA